MFPGISPIYNSPTVKGTNVPPVGDDLGWSLHQSPPSILPSKFIEEKEKYKEEPDNLVKKLEDSIKKEIEKHKKRH